MSAYKDTERRTWYYQFRYTDYQGRTHRTTKRGFRTNVSPIVTLLYTAEEFGDNCINIQPWEYVSEHDQC